MITNEELRAYPPPLLIYRTVALRVTAFEKLKHIQRELEAEAGRPMTNAEVISAAIHGWPFK